jgi:hypothetical protein
MKTFSQSDDANDIGDEAKVQVAGEEVSERRTKDGASSTPRAKKPAPLLKF